LAKVPEEEWSIPKTALARTATNPPIGSRAGPRQPRLQTHQAGNHQPASKPGGDGSTPSYTYPSFTPFLGNSLANDVKVLKKFSQSSILYGKSQSGPATHTNKTSKNKLLK